MEKHCKNIEIDEILQEIRTVMPNIKITRKNLTHPNTDSVMEFYTQFWLEMESHLQDFETEDTEGNIAPITDNVWDEMFVKMSSVFQSNPLTFTFEDIYVPQPNRIKYIFKICAHFLSFVAMKKDDFKEIFDGVSAMARMAFDMSAEEDAIKEQLQNNVVILSDLKIEKLRVSQKYDELVRLRTELLNLKQEHDEVSDQKMKKLTASKMELKNKTRQLEKLRMREKDLTERVVKEEEYLALEKEKQAMESNLKQCREAIEKIENDIKNENNNIQSCVTALNKILTSSDRMKAFLNISIQREQNLAKTKLQIEELSEILQDLKKKREEFSEKSDVYKKEIKTMKNKLKRLNAKKSNEDKLHGEVEQWKNKLKEAREINAKLKEEFEEVTGAQGDKIQGLLKGVMEELEKME